MILEMRAGFGVQEQIQVNTEIHPCKRPKNLLYFGAKAEDHRYCAPTVGSMDASSASESAINVVPIPGKMLP
jgi:hypothetical protein